MRQTGKQAISYLPNLFHLSLVASLDSICITSAFSFLFSNKAAPMPLRSPPLGWLRSSLS